MSHVIQIRRGEEANRTNVTPAAGEALYTTDGHRIFVGDGNTAGGIEVDYIKIIEKGVASGVATLDTNGKIPTTQMPSIAISDTFVVADQNAMLGLTCETGDVAVRTDENKSYILKGTDPSQLSDWQELLSPTDAVSSVNGQTGTVVLTTDDINEGSTNLYYTDARVLSKIGATSIDALSDVDTTTNAPTSGQFLKWDGTNWVPDDVNIVTSFIALTDTPANYTGSAGKFAKVNSAENGLEFSNIIDGGLF